MFDFVFFPDCEVPWSDNMVWPKAHHQDFVQDNLRIRNWLDVS
jgi:hypothetical protein